MENKVARRVRVLIADDNRRVVKSLSRLLAIDYDVVGSVGNGSELVEAAQRLKPDIVVLDLSLGDGDSLEACRQITKRNPAIKVIVFTGEDDSEIRDRAVTAGASAFVDKLFADSLLSAVKRLDSEAK
jgi:DNA-binding NarL/FixJ family response regulator